MLSLGRTERDSIPTAAGELPVVGHLPVLYRDAIGLLRSSSSALGPLFWVNFGFAQRRLFYVGSDALELLREPELVMDHPEHLKGIVGRSTVGQDGPSHRRMRSALYPSFSPQGFAKEVSATIAAVFDARIDACLRKESFAVHPTMRDWTLDIMLRICGVPTQDVHAWSRAYRELFLGVYPIPCRLPGLPAYRSDRARAWIDDHLRELLALARAGRAAGSLVEMLSNARDDEGEPLSDQAIVDNVRAILLAGHETSASILAWIIIVLARQRELWSAICEEHTAAPDASVPMSAREAHRFPVANAIFREVLRLYAPAWFIFRTVTDAITLNGRRLPPRTPLALSPTYFGHDPSLFPDPDRFDVSRWKDRSSPPGPLELAPFGGGPHFCLGYNIACIEALQLQFFLVRALRRAGLIPCLEGPSPKQVYLPAGHPTSATRVAFRAR
ncbi:cytochrome P450 [Sorangium sp. So ce1000]|uniref:cytochrome P450 n=1 Tax=Sorangium sp. So ce1000 TaxID=3133325 RepID=UPI003F5FF9F0